MINDHPFYVYLFDVLNGFCPTNILSHVSDQQPYWKMWVIVQTNDSQCVITKIQKKKNSLSQQRPETRWLSMPNLCQANFDTFFIQLYAQLCLRKLADFNLDNLYFSHTLKSNTYKWLRLPKIHLKCWGLCLVLKTYSTSPSHWLSQRAPHNYRDLGQILRTELCDVIHLSKI